MSRRHYKPPKTRHKGRTIMNTLKDKADDFLADLNAAFTGHGTPDTVSTPTTSYVAELDAAYGNTYGQKPSTTTTPTKEVGFVHTPGLPAVNTGSKTSYKKYAGKVMIALDGTDNFDGPYEVGNSYRDWWEEAIKHYPPTDDTIVIPVKNVSFTYASVKFNGCVFTATDEYLKARWGRTLHSTDRDWLAAHPLSTDDGVPQEYMATCVHAMLEPYGMGVSRVRLRRGTLAAGEPLQQFMLALGVNPFAMVDRETSNKVAAEKMGISLEQAEALWRFEFHDDPLPGCTIIAEKGWSNGKGVSTGYMGGHARYLAPRARQGNWAVSLQLAPLEQIAYDAPIVSPDYVPRKGDATLSLDAVKVPDGSAPVAVNFRGTFYAPEVAKAKEEQSKQPYKSTSTPKNYGSHYHDPPGTPDKASVETTALPDQSFVTYENGFKKTVIIRNGIKTTRLQPDYGGGKGKATVTPDKPPFTPIADVLAGEAVLQESLTGDAAPAPVPSQLSLLSEQRAAEHAVDTDALGVEMLECEMCHTVVPLTELTSGTAICLDCYDQAWNGIKCPNPKCATDFSRSNSPWFVERDEEQGVTTFECPRAKCKQIMAVHDDELDVRLAGVVHLAKHCPAMSADEFDQLLDDYLIAGEEERAVQTYESALDEIGAMD